MPQQRATFAILFADIAQSTALYERHGDTIAQRMIAGCFAALTEVTNVYNGRVIKTIGDEIMCAFPAAQDAVEAARNMPTALENISLPGACNPYLPLLRIGIHYGPVIVEQGDIFGDAVNVAARMVSMAKQNQIIMTRETVDVLPVEYTDCVRCIDRTRVKGKSGEMLIYEVLCERETATVMLKPPSGMAFPVISRMELVVEGKFIEVNEGHPIKTLGRQGQNDIVIDDYRVSRAHARIEYRKGKFFLVDQSTNGTYVVQNGKSRVLLRRDEMLLEGSGFIGLYDEVNALSTDAVHYAVKGVSR